MHVALDSDALESEEFVKNVWERGTSALHAVNKLGKTPFHYVVENHVEWAIGFFKWKMTFDEFLSAFSHDTQSREMIRPFLARECEALRVQFLNLDLVGGVRVSRL